jgi:uncharacterized membrane protein YphA (DoxX/SURF4 family)
MNIDTMKKYAPTIVRVGIALVVLWFGSQQITSPDSWIRLIPDWATGATGLSALTLVKINGWTEIIFGLLHLVGFWTRISALILTLHLAMITFVVGYGPVGVRDFGLTLAALSTFLNGASPLSVDSWRKRSVLSSPQI